MLNEFVKKIAYFLLQLLNYKKTNFLKDKNIIYYLLVKYLINNLLMSKRFSYPNFN